MDHEETSAQADAPQPELLCPGCAQKSFTEEEKGMRCDNCRGLLASGPRARATIAKSVAQGVLDAPQGALSCAQCADLLVPVDFEDHRYHACASCRLVWSPNGAAPSLPPARRGKTLRFGPDRTDLRPDGTAVVVSAKRMEEWTPKKRHVARVQIEDAMYQVMREVPQEEGRWRYELGPFDATKTMLIGPAIQYDAWYVDARDGVVADLPSPEKTARRALLAVVIAAPLIVGVLYFKPYERWLAEPPAAPARDYSQPRRPPPPKVVRPRTPVAPNITQPKTAPSRIPPEVLPVPASRRTSAPRPTLVPNTDRVTSVRPPAKKKIASPTIDLVLSRASSGGGALEAQVRIAGKMRNVSINARGENTIPLEVAADVARNIPPREGVPIDLFVQFPGGGTKKLKFRVTRLGSIMMGNDFMQHYRRIGGTTGLRENYEYID